MPYITFRVSKESKHKARLFHYLESIGCVKLTKNLWKLPLGSVKRVKSRLNALGLPYILLRKKRTLDKIEITPNNFRLGSLIVVAYSLPPDTSSNRTRKCISRLLRRSPYLRINRKVYAWSQINFKRFIPQGSKIIGPREFVKAIKELGGEPITIPRIIVEENVALKLIETIKAIRAKECISIHLASTKLMKQLKESAIDVITAKKSFNELKARFTQTKEIIFFLKKVYKIDLMKEYRKALRSINSCQKMLHQRIISR